jgi:predicted AAA+ superfamily ATPase
MVQRYINRSPGTVSRKAVSEFPAVVLTGSRQPGKTTLLPRPVALCQGTHRRPSAPRRQYVLTGSQNLLLIVKVTESLAGRAAMLRLLPLSRRDAEGMPEAWLPWELGKSPRTRSKASRTNIWKDFLRGYYPELVPTPGQTSICGTQGPGLP